ncbi:MAG: putative Ig domain-containing protein [Candidatus Dormiibacterota bacterium]
MTDTNGCMLDSASASVQAGSAAVIDPATNTVYEVGGNGVEVLSAACFGSDAADLCAGTYADQNPTLTSLALDVDTHTLYAAGTDAIDVINTATCNGSDVAGCAESCLNTCTPQQSGVVGQLATEGRMAGMAVDQATDTLYAANSVLGLVSVYDGANCNASQTSGCSPSDGAYCSSSTPAGCPPMVGQIDLGSSSYPTAVTVNQTTNTIYVADSGYETGIVDRVGGGSTVSVIDGATCSPLDDSSCSLTPPTVTVGTSPSNIAINEATNTVYVLNSDSATVSAIDGSTCDGADISGCGQSPLTVTIGPDLEPDAIAVDSTTGSVYVSDFGTETPCSTCGPGGGGGEVLQGGSLSVFGPNGPATPPTPPANTYELNLEMWATGTGGGTVTSSPPGISCAVTGPSPSTGATVDLTAPGASCSATFPLGTQLVLTESPSPSSFFEGWGSNGGDQPSITTTTLTVPITANDASDLGGGLATAFFDTMNANFSALELAGHTAADVGVALNWTPGDFLALPTAEQATTCQWAISGPSSPTTPAASTSACSFNTDSLVPGIYQVTLTTALAGSTYQTTQSVSLLPSVGFGWTLGVASSASATTVPLTLDACNQSIGVVKFDWSLVRSTVSTTVSSQSDETTDCQVTLNGPVDGNGQETTITLVGYDQQLTYQATSSAVVYIFAYIPVTTPPTCSLTAVNTTACTRQNPPSWSPLPGARPPDFAILQGSAGLTVSGGVDLALSCDGNIFVGAGGGIGIGTDDLPNIQLTAGVGWLGNPYGPEPDQSAIDGFLQGAGFSLGGTALAVGLNFLSTNSGNITGWELFFSSPEIDLSFAESLNTPLTTPVVSPAGQCPDGVFNSLEFQSLVDPALGVNPGATIVTPITSGSGGGSTATAVTLGESLYLSATGFNPGSQVSATLHSIPVSLGTTDADDTGAVGFVVTIPSDTLPGAHTIILTGFAPDGSALTETAAITIAPPLSIGSSSLPSGQVGSEYSHALGASGGSLPYTWSVTTGHLPAGLTLNRTTGAISGKPTAAGASTFSITVTDSTSPTPETSTASFSIAISKVGPAGGALAATSSSTVVPTTGADLTSAGLGGLLAVLFGGLLLIAGLRLRRTRAS